MTLNKEMTLSKELNADLFVLKGHAAQANQWRISKQIFIPMMKNLVQIAIKKEFNPNSCTEHFYLTKMTAAKLRLQTNKICFTRIILVILSCNSNRPTNSFSKTNITRKTGIIIKKIRVKNFSQILSA